MNKINIKEILYILMSIALGILAIKFIIWLLPVIIVAILGYYIYKLITKNIKKPIKNKVKKKTIKIIDMVEDK